MFIDNTGKSCHFEIDEKLIARLDNPQVQAAVSLKFAGFHLRADKLLQCGSFPVKNNITIYKTKTKRISPGWNYCEKHLCPQCSLWKAPIRYNKLINKSKQSTAGKNYFLTFTAPHQDTLRQTIDVLSDAFKACRQNKSKWKNYVLGYIRIVDISYDKEKGFHPHLHVIFTISEDADTFFSWLAEQWETQLLKATGERCRNGAIDIKQVNSGEISKVLNYITRAKAQAEPEIDDMGNERRSFWHLPAHAYNDLWEQTNKIHWFTTTGCWKIKNEPAKNIEREILAQIPRTTWYSLPQADRLNLKALINDVTVSDNEVCKLLEKYVA